MLVLDILKDEKSIDLLKIIMSKLLKGLFPEP